MARNSRTATKKPRRKKKTAAQKRQRAEKRRQTVDGIPPQAMNVTEFCDAHDISRDFFYELLKNNLGPDCMLLRKRRLISFEAAARWRAAGPRSPYFP